jgi:hypothetical protein
MIFLIALFLQTILSVPPTIKHNILYNNGGTVPSTRDCLCINYYLLFAILFQRYIVQK